MLRGAGFSNLEVGQHRSGEPDSEGNYEGLELTRKGDSLIDSRKHVQRKKAFSAALIEALSNAEESEEEEERDRMPLPLSL